MFVPVIPLPFACLSLTHGEHLKTSKNVLSSKEPYKTDDKEWKTCDLPIPGSRDAKDDVKSKMQKICSDLVISRSCFKEDCQKMYIPPN